MTSALMPQENLEISRRALIADLGATLAEQRAFMRDCELVRAAMPFPLATAIHSEGWIVEPAGGDLAVELASRYGNGRRRRRIIAIFLREAAAALHFTPSEFDCDEWALIALMNVGSIAYTPEGQAAGQTRRPSDAALGSRDRGCQAIARRGAGLCIVCGAPVDPIQVNGAVVDRSYTPQTCGLAVCVEEERFYTDAALRVFDRCDWLLAEAMTLRLDLLLG